MSEVMRWKLKGFIPGVEGVSKALFQPWVVPAEDFDRVTAELASANSDKEAYAQNAIDLRKRVDALQALLTAADERADVLEGLLLQTNELLYAIQGDPGAVPSSSIDSMRGRVFEALKRDKSTSVLHPQNL